MPPWFDAMSASNGRALAYVLYAGLARLGAAPPRASPLFILLLTVVLVGIGIGVCRLWGISGFGEVLIATCLIALHPYQTEIFTFRAACLIATVSLALAFAAILNCNRSKRAWWASLAALVCAMSIYQAVLNYIAMALLFSIAFQLSALTGRRPGWLGRLRTQLTLIVLAIALHVAFAAIVSRIAGVPLGQRTALLRPDEIGTRISGFVQVAVRLLFLDESVFPFASKVLLWIVFLTGGAGLLIDAARSGRAAAWRRVLVLVLTGSAGLPLCFGIILVLHEWWPVPRAIAHASLYCAGMIILVYMSAQRRLRAVIGIGLAIFLLSFIGIDEEILADQLRVNVRDFATANRMVMRIEALPGFRKITTVALSGTFPLYRSPILTMQGDMNIPALDAAWAKVGLLNEISGYRFGDAPETAQRQAEALCKGMPKWPEPESVATLGDSVAVVCLGDHY